MNCLTKLIENLLNADRSRNRIDSIDLFFDGIIISKYSVIIDKNFKPHHTNK